PDVGRNGTGRTTQYLLEVTRGSMTEMGPESATCAAASTCANEKGTAGAVPLGARGRLRGGPSQAVVHLVLDGVRRHAEAGHLVHLEFDVGVDHRVGEHTALGQEGAVLVEVVQGLVEAAAHGGDQLVLLGRQVVQVLGGGLARVDLVFHA